ncbi:MAG TPA: hypothetical protein VGM73_17250 [Candidatus Didemnitutus sp.]|jgi:hypothetical protein
MNAPIPPLLRYGLWAWLFGAMGIGASGVLLRLPVPAIQGVLAMFTALGVIVWRRIASVRAWVAQADMRLFIALHLTRFVGIYLVYLYRRGLLPYDFAVRGGIGDTVVAIAALALCVIPMAPVTRRSAIVFWNIFGLIDIILVVAAAAREGLVGNPQMRALAVLPLSLLPTFLVPLIVVTHFILFSRVLARDSGTAP